jgi:inorganic pyrophosphatase/exopolyphosphatase
MRTIGVLGNEACDADSIVSAICYSWFLNCTAPDDVEYVAFVQCAEEDLLYRLDYAEICRIVSFQPRRLHSIRAIPSPVSGWILVDHHYPSKLMLNIGNALDVAEIIDHHEVISDEATEFVESVSCVDIRTIGSTCTVIGERILNSRLKSEEIPREILMMLFLVIVLDTGDLSPELGKTTKTDEEIYSRLKTILGISDVGPMLDRIMKSKFSREFWYGYPLDTVFLYDFKEIDHVGYSVILRSIVGIEDSYIVSFAESRNLRVFVLSSGFYDESNNIHRELLLYLPVAQETADSVVKNVMKTVSVVTNGEFSVMGTVRFKILDSSFSRKKFFPALLGTLRDLNVF